jgi:hypothetical protein
MQSAVHRREAEALAGPLLPGGDQAFSGRVFLLLDLLLDQRLQGGQMRLGQGISSAGSFLGRQVLGRLELSLQTIDTGLGDGESGGDHPRRRGYPARLCPAWSAVVMRWRRSSDRAFMQTVYPDCQ